MPYVLRAFGAPVLVSSSGPGSIPTNLSPRAMTLPSTQYNGTGGMLPTYQALSSYAVNGQFIDTPWIATTPWHVTWEAIPPGSIFLLSFINPSTNTQTLLTNGSVVTMTFALVDGTMVTGPISLQVTQGSIWLVVCTTITTISILHS